MQKKGEGRNFLPELVCAIALLIGTRSSHRGVQTSGGRTENEGVEIAVGTLRWPVSGMT